ncbi:hypothetical protein AVEN_130530-1 [Araneus ventricosus]|uniref:Uncharacterized protein n=1 Tax=Araneus ventricosus TaxID=182803 RepID=A0A4Y2APW0_ARAVE|nr:hypothetical protein AVEN_130530-1 [Araneus ventricosus]
MVKSQFRGWRIPGSELDSTEKLACMLAWCSLNLISKFKHLPVGEARKSGERETGSGVDLVIYHGSNPDTNFSLQQSCNKFDMTRVQA